MDFVDRSVIITGGTGALGSAVVGALLEAGASCHIPVFNEAELDPLSLPRPSARSPPIPAATSPTRRP